ncbi:MAG: hypothetical protein IJQ20_07275 [Paludibacteraceae bacterium]|nr:hypothetical protein [Paludibacteraceae bacterium]
MKKAILPILLPILLTGMSRTYAENIGVPAECEDVMLQVFYWDSYKTQTSTDSKYGRTKWIDLLKDTAAINSNFDLVWFPPSAGPTGSGVGYSAKQYSNQDGDWGTKQKLNQLIEALHAGNTKVIADIVINHRGSGTSWCTFLTDNFGSYGSWTLTQKQICRNDECFTNSSSNCYNAATSDRGSADTGSNFDGARDLDHTSEVVQNWAKAYTQWLLDVMKYDGFRYDMTLGYDGQYLSMYNESANPYISVSELWESLDRQKQHLVQANYNTMIFDFPLKYSLNDFKGESYGKLNKNKALNSLRSQGLERYSVTFIDNHDTFERSDNQGGEYCGYKSSLANATIKKKILQANAYILMMPGIPCVFWPHWKSYQSEINELIAVRKRAGIHSESEVTDETSSQNNYEATIIGHKGKVILHLGSKRSTEVPEGYEVAAEGGDEGLYSIFIAMNPQGLDEVESGAMKSEKFIENGKLLIRRGEYIYDILGNRIL